MTSFDTQCRETVESGRMERGAGRSVRFAKSESFTRPATQAVSGGNPSIPSVDAGGAKMGGVLRPAQAGARESGVFLNAQSTQAAKSILRPNCLNPGDLCAGSGPRECFACRSAAAKQEAA